ncbi:AlpA family phage regulatory protein [Mesorhizobium sp. VK25A]|uniref:AlpA family phage regulatory protein n=1 Tax=Mesorhizobium vachelliae TaxID=3072309 RepID=A0ABU5A9D6_9HYPH|nr:MULTISPECIES: AlpA family phage regulatory protein [unclassified Mesorhizobium]MDX8532811.1 AlpA family phage regulatory protein [Mesorhizobium sp. VK25D]MDX8544683.1 AlpA family phage regulatory protein [Mesorhizobium sp. VK25A]
MATPYREQPPGIPPDNSLLRIKSIVAPGGPIPVSRSTWWAGVRSGRFPKPVKLGPRTTVWRSADIRELIESLPPSHPD